MNLEFLLQLLFGTLATGALIALNGITEQFQLFFGDRLRDIFLIHLLPFCCIVTKR